MDVVNRIVDFIPEDSRSFYPGNLLEAALIAAPGYCRDFLLQEEARHFLPRDRKEAIEELKVVL
jgi:hypothetical protein